MGPRATDNGATSTLTKESNSTTLKTPITTVFSKLNEFHKLTRKIPLQGHFGKFGRIEILAKVPYPNVKFDKKHDGDVAGPVRDTVLELYPTFMQK